MQEISISLNLSQYVNHKVTSREVEQYLLHLDPELLFGLRNNYNIFQDLFNLNRDCDESPRFTEIIKWIFDLLNAHGKQIISIEEQDKYKLKYLNLLLHNNTKKNNKTIVACLYSGNVDVIQLYFDTITALKPSQPKNIEQYYKICIDNILINEILYIILVNIKKYEQHAGTCRIHTLDFITKQIKPDNQSSCIEKYYLACSNALNYEEPNEYRAPLLCRAIHSHNDSIINGLFAMLNDMSMQTYDQPKHNSYKIILEKILVYGLAKYLPQYVDYVRNNLEHIKKIDKPKYDIQHGLYLDALFNCIPGQQRHISTQPMRVKTTLKFILLNNGKKSQTTIMQYIGEYFTILNTDRSNTSELQKKYYTHHLESLLNYNYGEYTSDSTATMLGLILQHNNNHDILLLYNAQLRTVLKHFNGHVPTKYYHCYLYLLFHMDYEPDKIKDFSGVTAPINDILKYASVPLLKAYIDLIYTDIPITQEQEASYYLTAVTSLLLLRRYDQENIFTLLKQPENQEILQLYIGAIYAALDKLQTLDYPSYIQYRGILQHYFGTLINDTGVTALQILPSRTQLKIVNMPYKVTASLSPKVTSASWENMAELELTNKKHNFLDEFTRLYRIYLFMLPTTGDNQYIQTLQIAKHLAKIKAPDDLIILSVGLNREDSLDNRAQLQSYSTLLYNTCKEARQNKELDGVSIIVETFTWQATSITNARRPDKYNAVPYGLIRNRLFLTADQLITEQCKIYKTLRRSNPEIISLMDADIELTQETLNLLAKTTQSSGSIGYRYGNLLIQSIAGANETLATSIQLGDRLDYKVRGNIPQVVYLPEPTFFIKNEAWNSIAQEIASHQDPTYPDFPCDAGSMEIHGVIRFLIAAQAKSIATIEPTFVSTADYNAVPCTYKWPSEDEKNYQNTPSTWADFSKYLFKLPYVCTNPKNFIQELTSRLQCETLKTTLLELIKLIYFPRLIQYYILDAHIWINNIIDCLKIKLQIPALQQEISDQKLINDVLDLLEIPDSFKKHSNIKLQETLLDWVKKWALSLVDAYTEIINKADLQYIRKLDAARQEVFNSSNIRQTKHPLRQKALQNIVKVKTTARFYETRPLVEIENFITDAPSPALNLAKKCSAIEKIDEELPLPNIATNQNIYEHQDINPQRLQPQHKVIHKPHNFEIETFERNEHFRVVSQKQFNRYMPIHLYIMSDEHQQLDEDKFKRKILDPISNKLNRSHEHGILYCIESSNMIMWKNGGLAVATKSQEINYFFLDEDEVSVNLAEFLDAFIEDNASCKPIEIKLSQKKQRDLIKYARSYFDQIEYTKILVEKIICQPRSHENKFFEKISDEDQEIKEKPIQKKFHQ